VADFLALQTKEARCWYGAILALWIVGYLVNQIFIPLYSERGLLTWSMSPYSYPLSFAGASACALFCSVGICANVSWYALGAAIALSRHYRNLSRTHTLSFAVLYSRA
jgi:hypothetical protein